MIRLLWVLFSGWLAIGPGQHFDPSRDLPEYDACTSSTYAGLYQLEHFRSLAGKDLSAGELEEVRRAWDAERTRATAEIQKLEADPTTRAAWDVKAHRFFSSVLFEMRVRGDVVVFIEKPPKPAAEYVDVEERKFGPPAAAVVRHFAETFAAPLALERQKAIPLITLIVLGSRKTFDDFGRSLPESNPFADSVTAFYDSRSHVVATYEPGDLDPDATKNAQRCVLRETTRALLDAHAANGLSSIQVPWFVAGFTACLGAPASAAPDGSILAGPFDPDVVRHCASLLRGQRAGLLLFPAIADLVTASNANDTVRPVKERLEVEGVPFSEKTATVVAAIFDDASHLLVRFLLDAEGGRYRPGMLQHVKAVLSGKSGPDAFLQSFGQDTVSLLEKTFRADVVARMEKEGITVRANSSSFAPARLTLNAPTSLPAIVVPPPSRAVQVGAALQRAKSGDVLGGLEDARKAGADPDDVAFLESLAKLGDEVLEAERKSDRNLAVKGKTPALGKVARFDANSLVLTDAKGREVVLPRSAFGPDQVLDRIRSKQLAVGSPELIASTTAFVARPAADAGASAVVPPNVRERAARWKVVGREVDAHARVEQLAKAATTLPADVEACVKDIDALLTTLRDSEAVRANHSALLVLGMRLLESSYARSDDVLAAFKGKVTQLTEGRIEVRFEDANALAEFVEDKRYGDRILSYWYGSAGRDKRAGSVSVTGGTIALEGFAATFHPVGFAAPCTIEFDLKMLPSRDRAYPTVLFNAIALDDSRGSYCAYNWVCVAACNIAVRGFRSSDPKSLNSGDFEWDTTYRFKLEHTGREVSLSVNGTSRGKLADVATTNGRIGFVVDGPCHFEISKLVVRGKVDATTLTERRAAWVSRRTSKWQADAKH